ncbi:MAG TPA: diguanylate cyclase [Candidatus Acidoferrum sp.]|nr:diguanylate cyclase [Candidatus Acidoferrum sp.]
MPPAKRPDSPASSTLSSAQTTGVSAIDSSKPVLSSSSVSVPIRDSAELVVHLAEENASLELALDDLPDPILWMDGNCRIYKANRAASDAFGKQLPGVLGRPCYEVIHGTSSPPADCPHLRVQASGRPERGECAHIPHERTFDMAASPCGFAPEGLRGCVAVLRDLTGHRSAENALRSECHQLDGRAKHLESRLQELSLLGEMEDMLQVCDSPQKTYSLLAHFASKLFGEDSGALRLLRSRKRLLETAAVWGENPPSSKPFSAENCSTTRSARAAGHQNSVIPCRHATAASSAHSMCFPVTGQGEILGSLEVVLAAASGGSKEVHFSDAMRRRAITVAGHFGRALINLRIRQTLRGVSIRDPLTGLFNRRYLDEVLEREVHRATRANRPLSVTMLDVDHFKHFNDAHGHPAGDELLRSIARMLQSRTRREDVICRYGGEEFVMVLPEAPLVVGRRRAEELRAEALRLQVKQNGSAHKPVTLSLGVASLPLDGSNAKELLASADRHLYIAKRAGRDKVVTGDHPPKRAAHVLAP